MFSILNKQLHSAWLLAMMAASLLVGTVISRFATTGFGIAPLWVVVAVIMMAYALYRQRLWCVIFVVIAGLLLGYGRGSHEILRYQQMQSSFGRKVILTGRISEDVSKKSGTVRANLDGVSVNGKKQAGIVWVSMRGKIADELKRSDTVTLQGKLEPGFATFNGVMYEAKITNIQRHEHSDIAREVRDWFADIIRRVIPGPESDLGIGFLVGQKTALPDDLLEALKIAGLTHVVVASGYNLTILVRLARRLFMKISKYMSLVGASGLVLCFVMVTGASPSMTRAAIVTGLSLAAWYYGRNIHPVILLLLSAAITVYIEPRFAWGDAGWLLSFTAFAGVLIVAPLLQSYFFGDKKPGVVRQILGETLSAQLLTMPIIMYMFGTVSFVALLANVLILPFVPLAMLLVFIAGILGLIYMPLAVVFGNLAYWLLGYMVWITKQLAGFSWASSEISLPLIGVFCLYAGMLITVLYLHRATKYKLSQVNIVE